MAVTYLRLFPAVNQFELRNGMLNVAGRLYVYYQGTDDLADIYDENGTQLQQPAILDSDGRAPGLFVDSARVYWLKVCDRFDDQQYTVQKMVPSGGGGGSSIGGADVSIISTDGSIVVDESMSSDTKTFDISVSEDATENLEWSKVSGTGSITEDGPLALQYQAGSMTVVNGKLRLEDDQFYHITTHFDVVPNAQGNTYDTLTFTLYKVNDDNETGLLRTFVKDVDSSLTDPIVVEYSTDIVTDEAVLVYWTVEGIADGISVGLADMYAHRVYSGIPRLPENEYASQEWVTENFQSLSGMSAYQTTADMSAYATKGELATKLDASASSQFALSSSLADYQKTADMTAYLPVSASSSLFTGVDSDTSLTGIGTSASPLGVNTAILSDYQPTSSMSAYATTDDLSGYLPVSASSELFTGASTDTSLTGLGTSASPLGVNTAILSDYQQTADMTAYQTTADMTGYLPVSATSELFTGITHDTSLTGSGTSASPLGANSMCLQFDSATMETSMSGDTAVAGVRTSILSAYQPTSDMSAYATKSDVSANYQPTSAMSAYQETSGMTAYLPVSASSSLFTGVVTDTSLTGSGLSSNPLGVKTREILWDSATITTSESGTSAKIGVNPSLFDGFQPTSSMSAYATTDSLSAYATTGDLADKLDASASSQFAQSSSLADYQQTADMSAYATTDSLSAYATTGDLADKLDTSASSQFAQSSSLSNYQPTSSMSNYATTAALADKLDKSAQVVTSVSKYGSYVTGINGSQLNAYSASTASNASNATYATYDANGRALTSIGQGGNYTSESGTIYISGDDIESTDTAYITGATGVDTTTSTSYNPNQLLTLFNSVDGGANVELQGAWGLPVTAYLGDVSAVISSWDQMPYRMSIVARGMPIYFSATNGFTVLNATSFTGNAPRTAELAHKTALSAYQPTSAMSAYATTASLATKLDSTASSQFAQSSSLSSYQPTSAMSAYATTTDLTAKLDASAQVVTAMTYAGTYVSGLNGDKIQAKFASNAGVATYDENYDPLTGKLNASAQVVTAVNTNTASLVTGINGIAIAAGSTYSAGSYVEITGDTINVTGVQPTSAMSAYALASSVANADWEQTATSSPAYIENKPDLVDIVAGPGIVVDNPDGNTLRVSTIDGYDTVLWSGNTNIVTDNYVTLSEQASNFSIIQVQFGDNAGGWSTITLFPGTATRWAVTKAASNDASTCIMDIAELTKDSSDSLKWIFRYPRRLTFNSNNTFSFTNNAGVFYLKKIVGIHRIANN